MASNSINRRFLLLLLLILIILLGFIPTRYIAEFIFKKPVAAKPAAPNIQETRVPDSRSMKNVRGTGIPAESPSQAKSPERLTQKPVQEPDKFFDKIVPEPAVERIQEPKPQPAARIDAGQDITGVEIFDPMENKTFWSLDFRPGDTANISVHRGIDSKAIALFYNLEPNGWASIVRTGDWDFSRCKGIRFTSKTDGITGEFTLLLSYKNNPVLQKTWSQQQLSGSSWKISVLFFGEQKNPSNVVHLIDRVEFRMSSQKEPLKGRIVIDNMELIQ